jgi:SAM-dependent methyltransferase
MSDITASIYGGADNLEIMEEARNYNAFLQGLVTAHAHPEDRILDFGAGTGLLAHLLTAAGYRVSCIEPDPRLRAQLQTSGLVAYATLDEIEPESLDLIYTVNVLEHIADDENTALGLRGRLRPGGKLLVYVPAFPILYSSMDRKVGHVRRYRRTGLETMLRRAGFGIDLIAYKDCLGFAASLLFKWFGNDTGMINRRGLAAYDRYVFPLSCKLDHCTVRWFGKNLFALAHRP